jgi:hypothetical protein
MTRIRHKTDRRAHPRSEMLDGCIAAQPPCEGGQSAARLQPTKTTADQYSKPGQAVECPSAQSRLTINGVEGGALINTPPPA